MAGKKTYAIGKGKTPEATRFKKGQTGNPQGRPKGSPNRNAIIRKVLGQLVGGAIDGRRKRIPVTEASLLRLSQQALVGDLKAIQMVLALWKEAEDALANEHGAEYPFSDADRQVIEDIYARMKAVEGRPP